jgi:transposase-like protein
MIERAEDVVIRMLENAQPVTIAPLIKAAVKIGSRIFTDEYDIYSRVVEWGYEHKRLCHGQAEHARDVDGDDFHKILVNSIEGFWSWLRSWLRPPRGISQEYLPLYLCCFDFIHNTRKRGKALLGSLLGLILC